MNFTVESVNAVASWSAMVFGLITALAVTVQYYTSGVLEVRKQAQDERKQAQIDEANSVAVLANESATIANAELAKLKAPRAITSQQKAHLVAALNSFGSQKFRGAVSTGASDAIQLWQQIASTLQAAGWIVIEPQFVKVGSPAADLLVTSNVGVMLAVEHAAPDAVKSTALHLKEVLNSVDIKTSVMTYPPVEISKNEIMTPSQYRTEEPGAFETITIEIGFKPSN